MRGRLLLVLGGVALTAYLVVGPRFPKDQSVNVVLGNAAPDATEVTLRYTADGERDSARDVVLHFDEGKAPRVVHHEPRLADGPYVVAIEVRGPRGSLADERHVALHGDGSTSINLDSEPLRGVGSQASLKK